MRLTLSVSSMCRMRRLPGCLVLDCSDWLECRHRWPAALVSSLFELTVWCGTNQAKRSERCSTFNTRNEAAEAREEQECSRWHLWWS